MTSSRRLTLGLTSVALAAAVVALAPSGSGDGTDRPPPSAPVLSLRRVPELTSRLAADAKVETALARALDEPGLAGARQQACLVVSDASGRPIFRRDPQRSLVPASTLKVLTGAVVLDRLGADTRYRTELRSPAGPSDGTVGDVWLVGSGDPLLATADYAATAGFERRPRAATPLEVLADRVVAAGVRRIDGRILGDETRYDGQRYVPTWKPSYISDSEVGPIGALTVNNGFTSWTPKKTPAPAPAAHAAEVLATLLRARGVEVGGVGEGPAPDAAPLAFIDSPPLAEVVAEMLRQSDNTAAELMVKELGARYGRGGSTESGLEVLRASLAGAGLPTSDLASFDGSGLDRADRATCRLLLAALESRGDDSALARALPTAGRDGTLARRYLGTPAAGRLRAKTGSLNGVVGLSGWADGRQGRRVAFALLANGLPSDAAGRALQDRVGTALVDYPDGPPPEALGP